MLFQKGFLITSHSEEHETRVTPFICELSCKKFTIQKYLEMNH